MGDSSCTKTRNDLTMTTLTKKDYKKFVSLVKRMREAQEAFQNAISSEDIDQIDMCQIRMLDLEREVDEYLKKMEEQ